MWRGDVQGGRVALLEFSHMSCCNVYSWSKLKSCGRRPPKTAVATFEAFQAESSWTAGASKSARQLSATAPCINPRHFELGIPTLHVLVQPFISKQSKIKHATTTSLLRRWRDGSLDGLSSYFQPFLYFGCDFRRRAAVTGPKETSQINLYFQYKTKKEFRVSSAEHAWPARACCL